MSAMMMNEFIDISSFAVVGYLCFLCSYLLRVRARVESQSLPKMVDGDMQNMDNGRCRSILRLIKDGVPVSSVIGIFCHLRQRDLVF